MGDADESVGAVASDFDFDVSSEGGRVHADGVETNGLEGEAGVANRLPLICGVGGEEATGEGL